MFVVLAITHVLLHEDLMEEEEARRLKRIKKISKLFHSPSFN
jgi:hypothetical protein